MRRNSGFTLVEIMIVLTLIGLLAVMAVPAFIKVRAASAEKTIINDGRQLGSAFSQYFLEYGQESVDAAEMMGSEAYVKNISPNNRVITQSGDSTYNQGETFMIENNLYGQIVFNEDGSIFEKKPGVLTE